MNRIASSTASRWLAAATLTLSLVVLAGTAWALGPGSPPQVGFASVWIATTTSDHFPSLTSGVPQLLASVDTLVLPGGSVPASVQSVRVEVPGGGGTFTLTKDTSDLFIETGYSVNLTQAGVVGFPAGTYTFTVTDTAGGESTVTDDLDGAAVPLAAATGVTISGATTVSPDLFRASFSSTSTPTVSWTPAPGAVAQRLRVRHFGGPDLLSRFINDGTTSSLALPAGLFAPGRVHEILVDAEDVDFLPNTNTRGRRAVRLIVEGPDVIVARSGGTGDGDTLTVTVTAFNPGPPVTVAAVVWLGVPDGRVIELLRVDDLVLGTATQDTPLFGGPVPVFTRTWDGSEPTGTYVLGVRVIGGLQETLAAQTTTFTR